MTKFFIQGTTDLSFEEATKHNVSITQRRTVVVDRILQKDAESHVTKVFGNFKVEESHPATEAELGNEFIPQIY